MKGESLSLLRTIMLSRDAATTIVRIARDYDDGLEAGGILLGEVGSGIARVRHAGTPGPAAVREAHYFLRDLAHAQDLALAAYERDGSVWVGEWHTHPHSDSTPSQLDIQTYQTLLTDPELRFDVVLAIILGRPAADCLSGFSMMGWVCTPVGVRAVPIAVVDEHDPVEGAMF
ncbi:Mov34/MPN/PAD-1 family protein [Lentzea californiensis]|uniref:Mov34/MPN/PAD-1 family protein n=1 Tax=Lentzea californiensis TaxID=438851 RepID=UPI00216512CA|nr:Mov34/MPN/PAD-1 family protein [Lentzea californiensis]